jgi:hypothetical protein
MLQANQNQPELSAAACHAISILAVNDVNSVKLSSAGVNELVLSTINDLADYRNVIVEACRAVSSLCINLGNCGYMGVLGCVKSLHRIIKKYSKDNLVQGAAWNAVANLAMDEGCNGRCGQLGILQLLIKTLKTNFDLTVNDSTDTVQCVAVLEGARALSKFAVLDSNVDILFENDICVRVITALQFYSTDIDICIAIAISIFELSKTRTNLQLKFSAENACVVLIQLLHQYGIESAQLTKEFCATLYILVHKNTANQVQISSLDISISTLISPLLEVYSDNGDVSPWLLRMISALCDNNESNQLICKECYILDRVVQSLITHCKSSSSVTYSGSNSTSTSSSVDSVTYNEVYCIFCLVNNCVTNQIHVSSINGLLEVLCNTINKYVDTTQLANNTTTNNNNNINCISNEMYNICYVIIHILYLLIKSVKHRQNCVIKFAIIKNMNKILSHLIQHSTCYTNEIIPCLQLLQLFTDIDIIDIEMSTSHVGKLVLHSSSSSGDGYELDAAISNEKSDVTADVKINESPDSSPLSISTTSEMSPSIVNAVNTLANTNADILISIQQECCNQGMHKTLVSLLRKWGNAYPNISTLACSCIYGMCYPNHIPNTSKFVSLGVISVLTSMSAVLISDVTFQNESLRVIQLLENITKNSNIQNSPDKNSSFNSSTHSSSSPTATSPSPSSTSTFSSFFNKK